MKKVLVTLLLIATGTVFAQSTPAKKELVAKVLQLQQPGIEQTAANMVIQPTQMIMVRVGDYLRARIPPDKRAAVAAEIQGDFKKYVDQTVPAVRARAVALAPATIGTLLDERFTEEELKELIVIIESPVNRKFQQLGGEMLKAMGEKLVAEFRPLIETNIRTLDKAIAGHLGIKAPPAKAPASAAGG